MYNDPRRQIRRVLFQGGCPATIVLIAANVLTWFMHAIFQGANPAKYLLFTSETWPLPYFWTIVTWPLYSAGHPIFVLFALMATYWICGSLERSWGTRAFVGLFLAAAALTAFTTWIGSRILGVPAVVGDLWMAIAPPTVAWCVLNSRERIGLYFGLITVPALWLAVLTAIIVWYSAGHPVLGLFALSGCAAAYWYVTKARFTLSRGSERQRVHEAARRFAPERERTSSSGGGFNLARWWKERQERKRLEDIFRRSGFTDEDDRR
jgi:membrane associated rhomboid family serine protease